MPSKINKQENNEKIKKINNYVKNRYLTAKIIAKNYQEFVNNDITPQNFTLNEKNEAILSR